MPGVERTPSVQTIRNIVGPLSGLLRASGPNTPPGFETGILEEAEWALHLNFVVSSGAGMAEAFASDNVGGVVQGWPHTVSVALVRISETLRRILSEWGITRYADRGPCPSGEPDPTGVAFTLCDDDHAGLLWSLEQLLLDLPSKADEARARHQADEDCQGTGKPTARNADTTVEPYVFRDSKRRVRKALGYSENYTGAFDALLRAGKLEVVDVGPGECEWTLKDAALIDRAKQWLSHNPSVLKNQR